MVKIWCAGCGAFLHEGDEKVVILLPCVYCMDREYGLGYRDGDESIWLVDDEDPYGDRDDEDDFYNVRDRDDDLYFADEEDEDGID